MLPDLGTRIAIAGYALGLRSFTLINVSYTPENSRRSVLTWSSVPVVSMDLFSPAEKLLVVNVKTRSSSKFRQIRLLHGYNL